MKGPSDEWRVARVEEGGQRSFLFSIENMIKNEIVLILPYSDSLRHCTCACTLQLLETSPHLFTDLTEVGTKGGVSFHVTGLSFFFTTTTTCGWCACC